MPDGFSRTVHRQPFRAAGLSGPWILTAFVLVVVACLTLLPIGRLFMVALAPGGALDLTEFLARIARPSAWRATLNTVDTAFFGACAALALALPLTLAVALTNVPGRLALGYCIILPLMIAPQVTAIAWLHLFGPSSTLLHLVGLAPAPGARNPMLGRGGIILLYAVQHAPIVFIALRAGLAQVPRDLIEAARASGARPLRVLATVILPLIRPYLAAGFSLAFISGIGNFGIPALLGLPVNYLTLSTLIYQKLSSSGPDVLPDVAALSIIVTVATLVGIGLQRLATGGKPARMTAGPAFHFALGRWRLPVALAAWGVILLTLVLPALALIVTSLIPAFGVPLGWSTVTLDNYVEVLWRQASTTRAFVNSFLLSSTAALLLAGFALPLGWLMMRWPRRVATAVGGAIDLPYAIPGIVLAIAAILLFLKPLPLIGSLYATPWIILIAYLMRFLALAGKPVSTALAQIPPALDEAAAASGARPLRRLTTISAPLAAPAAIAGALLVFMSAFNELTVSALLWSSRHETLGVVLFSLEEAGLGTQAAAIAVTSLLVVIVTLGLIDRLGRRLPPGVLPWR
ncbi:ABC transporter permease [Rhizobium rhizosphaerae]|uniref:ABC transporter permease n=1 Tax=Xaviernesmea rhizosphaerae TaxID=1672749 RepID=UPI001FD9AFC0|nr:iron ABC transporter permease [Xaviernesmea rhizosphaerae]